MKENWVSILLSELLRNPALIAILSSVITAFASHVLAVKREKRQRVIEKKLEVYDRALTLLAELRSNPSRALDDDYYLQLMGLSTSMRAYGSNATYKTLRNAFSELQGIYRDYRACLAKIEEKCDSTHEETDPVTCEQVDIQDYPDWYILHDDMIAEVKASHTPSHTTTKQIVDRFADQVFAEGMGRRCKLMRWLRCKIGCLLAREAG